MIFSFCPTFSAHMTIVLPILRGEGYPNFHYIVHGKTKGKQCINLEGAKIVLVYVKV